MKNVLITGGTGMLGANLARRLVAEPCRVHVLVRAGSDRNRLADIERDVRFVHGDVTDPVSMRKAIQRVAPDAVYHLACTPFNPPTATAADHFAVNAMGTLHLLEALRDRPKTPVVFTGTGAVYEAKAGSTEDQPLKPATILGASKAAASILMQTYARLHGMRTVELRLFMPYGPLEHPRRLIPQTILAALEGRDLPMSRGEQQRDLVYVDDVVDALVRAARMPLLPGTVINIGSGVGTPIKDVACKIFDLIGTTALPLLGALPTRPDEIMVMSANVRKARELLDWTPRTSLDEGLQKTIEWMRAHRSVQPLAA